VSFSDSVLQAEHGLASHQSDAANRRRLRWRARRGLLENDLVLIRFFDKHEASLTDADITGLDRLLDLPDNDLLDLIFERKSASTVLSESENDALRVLALLQKA
jgi:antitoxin CptB